MEQEDSFTRCLAYLGSETQGRGGPVRVGKPPRLAVAMSRQTGSGAIRIAEQLAEYLQAHGPADERPWTVFDKELITKVLEDHHLPARLGRFLPEDKVNAISDAVDEILGLHPPSWLMVRQCMETILQLAELGNVILVGRGANVVTRRLSNVLRVRLVGSLERRVVRLMEAEHVNREQALEVIRRTDRGRARYVKQYLHQDVSDVLLYDLTVNTDHLSDAEVVRLLGDTVLHRIQVLRGELAQAA